MKGLFAPRRRFQRRRKTDENEKAGMSKHRLAERAASIKEKMKILKTKTLSTLSLAALALLFSACEKAGNTTVNNSITNTASSSTNTAVATNSNKAANSNTATASNTSPTPAGETEESETRGELQTGKTESVLLYVGEETGDYAAYCFSNDSEAGRAIMAACKNGEQCAVVGTVEQGSCKVPGLEADLSYSARIVKVKSAKSLGRKK